MHSLRLSLFVFATAAPLLAQGPGYTLRVEVPMVSLDVTVTDTAGRAVENLRAEDFRVYENDAEQKIHHFSPASAPYHVLLLFDRSGSTQHKWGFMARAVAGLIGYLKPQDKLAIGVFESKVEMIVRWQDSRERALAAMDRFADSRLVTGTTQLYRSVTQTLRREFKGIENRRAMLVLTDGRDTSFYLELVKHNRLLTASEDRNFQRVYKTATERRIPIYFVAVNTDRNLEPSPTGGDEYRNLQLIFRSTALPRQYLEEVRVRLETVAEVTGGRALFPRNFEEIIPLYEQIGRELGTSYSIGYIPDNTLLDGTFRRVVVRTRESTHRVIQSRSGYYAK